MQYFESYFSPPAYGVLVPESISSDKIHGAVGSEEVVEFECTGVMGEP
jgi:hypothetical protein